MAEFLGFHFTAPQKILPPVDEVLHWFFLSFYNYHLTTLYQQLYNETSSLFSVYHHQPV
jgi:hypothetical protein